MTQQLTRQEIERLEAVIAARHPSIVVDGVIDGQTRSMAYKVLEGAPIQDGSQSTLERLLVTGAQHLLNQDGHEAGDLDGWLGHNTREALRAWEFQRHHRRPETIERRARRGYRPPKAGDLPRQRDCAAFYGAPGERGEASRRQVRASTPFAFPLDYDLDTTVTTMRVHQLCAPHLEEALVAVEAEYGQARMHELGITRYAGGYMPRKMRGSASWSMHAYGCAIDLFAAPNGLRTSCPEALFCGREYQTFLDIMEAHGWLPAIRLWGRDAMHFQMARL